MDRLFLDDERDPPVDDRQGWTVARSVEQAGAWMLERGCPAHVAFDNDLGPGMPEGRELARRMVERDLDGCGGFIPPGFTWFAHTQNPVARDAIKDLLSGWRARRTEWLAAADEARPPLP